MPCTGAALIWFAALIITVVDGRYADALLGTDPESGDGSVNEIVSARGVLFITYRNAVAVVCNAAGGLSGGIYTAINLALNGGSLGMYVNAARTRGFSWMRIAAHTVPHFAEYIALWLSGGTGFLLTGFLIKRLRTSKMPARSDVVFFTRLLAVSFMLVLMGAVSEVWISVGVWTITR